MKRAISISVLFVVLFFIFQWGLIFFKKGHEVVYSVFFQDQTFQVTEKYQKKQGDYYDVMIENQNNTYYYVFQNEFNKQKRIVEKIEYYEENDYSCIFPILEQNEGTYLQCIQNDKIYTSTSFPNQDFISRIETDLEEKGYSLHTNIDLETTEKLINTTIYTNNLLDHDIITLWDYKGIQVIKIDEFDIRTVLGFDKYENSHGYLVDKYYIVPEYLSTKVLEFSEVTVIDLDTLEYNTIKLNYTLSSNTYMNGVIDHKLYYTDPSNLLQIEVNPSKKSSRLIGSKELGGQIYNGAWEDINIYDFVNSTITFQEEIPNEIIQQYSYLEMIEGDYSYYFTNQNGEVYQVPKEHLDVSILLFQASNLSNVKVVQDTIYYVVDNTVYYFHPTSGKIPILSNNELRYNTKNRIDVFRKS